MPDEAREVDVRGGMSKEARRDPAAVLRRIALLLEQTGAEAHRARAFRRAAGAVAALAQRELEQRAREGTLQALPGVGDVTSSVAADVLAGRPVPYLERLEVEAARLDDAPGSELLHALRGDCHVHSDWSDGHATIQEMAEAARDLGHDYMVLTDHSPSLRIARGLSPERLREQLDVVAALNVELAPFRILTGIEVDILEDGALDQEDELLARLDVVVGSVHSLLRMERAPMTERMLAAVAQPHLDILGHCTGRMRRRGRDRPESEFDAAAVFAACARHDKAVEVNSLPERRDPPRRLIDLALAAGCRFALDSDAHYPGQLANKRDGARRAMEQGVPAERIVNALDADALLAWTASHTAASRPGRAAGDA
ncbi:MAG: PHP domain-containing protein [Dehalococcoidia bacterium]